MDKPKFTLSSKAIDKIKNIILLSLQRINPQITEVKFETKSDYRGEEYYEVETNCFQTTPIIFKTLLLYAQVRPYEDSEEPTRMILNFNFRYRWVTFDGGYNGCDFGNIEIHSNNGHLHVPYGFVYSRMNY